MPQMSALAESLSAMAHTVFLPDEAETLDSSTMSEQELCTLKQRFIDDHLAKIRASDAVLIANYMKHGIEGYIGANTLMEIAFAYALGKPLFILNPVGEQGCRIEVLATKPSILNGDINNLTVIKLDSK